MERIKDIKTEAERYYENVGVTPTPEDLIEEIKRLDPDAKRSALIREAVIAFKPEYQKRLKYLKEREQQRR